MIAKRFEQVVTHVENARTNWADLHARYVQFRERAMAMMDAGCPAKGIVVQTVGDDFYVEFLDRRLRLSFGFDRIANRGVLCVDDMSGVGRYDGHGAVRIETISFDYAGDLGVVDADGESLSLSDPAHAIQLALGIVDAALDQNPWKVS